MVFVAVNQDRAHRGRVRIANWQSFESVTAHEFVAGFGRVSRLWIGTDHARGDQRVFYIVPAVRLRVRMRALLGECGRLGKFRIEPGIDFRKRMNDRFSPVMMDDPNGGDSPRAVLVNKLLGGFLEVFSSKRRGKKGAACRT